VIKESAVVKIYENIGGIWKLLNLLVEVKEASDVVRIILDVTNVQGKFAWGFGWY